MTEDIIARLSRVKQNRFVARQAIAEIESLRRELTAAQRLIGELVAEVDAETVDKILAGYR